VSHRRTTLTSAQPLGSRSPVLSHKHVQLSRSLYHCVTQENHLEYHIISTLSTEEANTSFHLCLKMIHPTHGLPHTWVHTTFHLSQIGTTHPTHGLHHLTQGHNVPYLSLERNHTPISWAHPTHGLSLRPTLSVCVLEDVSCSCNHKHSLSAREEFSTRPSLSRKYSNFILVVIINTPS
jgi:hypothetical protein